VIDRSAISIPGHRVFAARYDSLMISLSHLYDRQFAPPFLYAIYVPYYKHPFERPTPASNPAAVTTETSPGTIAMIFVLNLLHCDYLILSSKGVKGTNGHLSKLIRVGCGRGYAFCSQTMVFADENGG